MYQRRDKSLAAQLSEKGTRSNRFNQVDKEETSIFSLDHIVNEHVPTGTDNDDMTEIRNGLVEKHEIALCRVGVGRDRVVSGGRGGRSGIGVRVGCDDVGKGRGGGGWQE